MLIKSTIPIRIFNEEDLDISMAVEVLLCDCNTKMVRTYENLQVMLDNS